MTYINYLGAVLGSVVATALTLLSFLPTIYSVLKRMEYNEFYYGFLGLIIAFYLTAMALRKFYKLLHEGCGYIMRKVVETAANSFIYVMIALFLYGKPWIGQLMISTKSQLDITPLTSLSIHQDVAFMILIPLIGIYPTIKLFSYLFCYLISRKSENIEIKTPPTCCTCCSSDKLLRKIEKALDTRTSMLLSAGLQKNNEIEIWKPRSVSKKSKFVQRSTRQRGDTGVRESSDTEPTERANYEMVDGRSSVSSTDSPAKGKPDNTNDNQEEKKCYRCGGAHDSHRCWVLEKKVKCFECGCEGHIALKCNPGRNKVTLELDDVRRIEDVEQALDQLQKKMSYLRNVHYRINKKRVDARNFHQPATFAKQ